MYYMVWYSLPKKVSGIAMIWNLLSRFCLRAFYLFYHKWYHHHGETDNYTETKLENFFFLFTWYLSLCTLFMLSKPPFPSL